MTTDLFICTHGKDFGWLKYCLKSIDKFVSGFRSLTIVVPVQDFHELSQMEKPKNIELRLRQEHQWPEKGMLWHEYQIMRADEWCADADFIAHFDPDCVFTAPVTPDLFIKNGKPILRYERFDSICGRHPGIMRWKEAVNVALPFPVDKEFMRGHPEVYHRGLYKPARDMIAAKHRVPIEEYIRGCRNEFPQTFCEFATLGAVAYYAFHGLYEPFDCGAQTNPDFQEWPVQQFWSHGPIDQPQNIWVRGEQKTIVPWEFISQLGIL